MKAPISFILATALLIGAGCGTDPLGMDLVPSSADLQQHFPEFTLPGTQVEGVYANRDVDSRVFVCRLPPGPKRTAAPLATLKNAALRMGWQVRETNQSYLRLNRFKDTKPGQGRSFSAEEVRIVATSDHTLHIAWVQADTQARITRFENAGAEAEWAERVIWPKLHQRLLVSSPIPAASAR